MSDRVERRILSMLERPFVSPYGNPIPGLAELDVVDAVESRDDVVALPEAIMAGVQSATLVRIGEAPQTSPGLLADILELGLLPGAAVAVTAEGDEYTLSTAHGILTVGPDTARHVFVVAARS